MKRKRFKTKNFKDPYALNVSISIHFLFNFLFTITPSISHSLTQTRIPLLFGKKNKHKTPLNFRNFVFFLLSYSIILDHFHLYCMIYNEVKGQTPQMDAGKTTLRLCIDKVTFFVIYVISLLTHQIQLFEIHWFGD